MANRILLQVLNNSIFGYVSSRYLTYGLQFINSILIAAYLGPYFLGIWGFFNLIIQYCAKIDFGITHSVNTIASIEKEKKNYISLVIGNGIFGLIILSTIITGVLLLNVWMDLGLGSKYNMNLYYPFLLIIAIGTYFNALFSGVFRVYGKLMEIAFQQSLLPTITLLVILIFKEGDLLDALIWANALCVLSASIVYLIRLPIKIKFRFNKNLIKKIITQGFFLFLYSSSFYFIILSTRTFISNYYTITEFGYFTFAFSMANAFFLLLQAFNFLIWPKLINRLANFSEKKSKELISKLKKIYVTTSYFLAFIAIIFFPLILYFFPAYQATQEVFSLILLTIVLQTNSFGYQGLMVAKGQEKSVGILALCILFLNLILNFIIIKLFHIEYSNAILGTLVSYFFYVFFLVKNGRKILGLRTNIINVLKDGFPLSYSFPFILTLILSVLNLNSIIFLIPFGIFIILNLSKITSITELIKKVIQNTDVINKI